MIPYISHADATLQSSDQAEMMTAFIMRVTPQLPLLKAESARRKTERELGEAEHKLLLERLREDEQVLIRWTRRREELERNREE